MTLHARLPGLGWDEVLELLVRAGAEGALRVEGEEGSIQLLFQNGVVLLPLERTSGSRDEDQRLGNRRLLRALRWRRVTFRFAPGEVPPGTVARRSLVLRQDQLLQAARVRPRGIGSAEPTPALWGDLPGSWLPVLLRCLGARLRTGRLVLQGDMGERAILRLEAGELRPGSPGCEGERFLRRELLAVCRAPRLRVGFLAEGEAAEVSPLPANTGRLLAAAARQEDLQRRVQKLFQARDTGYRLREPGVLSAALELTGLPELVHALDGQRSFRELLALTGLPPLLAAHALARLLLEGLAQAGRRPAVGTHTDLALGSGDLRALASSSSSSSELAAPIAAPRSPGDLPPLGLEDPVHVVRAADLEPEHAVRGQDPARLQRAAEPLPAKGSVRTRDGRTTGCSGTPVPRRSTVRPAATRMRLLRAS